MKVLFTAWMKIKNIYNIDIGNNFMDMTLKAGYQM